MLVVDPMADPPARAVPHGTTRVNYFADRGVEPLMRSFTAEWISQAERSRRARNRCERRLFREAIDGGSIIVTLRAVVHRMTKAPEAAVRHNGRSAAAEAAVAGRIAHGRPVRSRDAFATNVAAACS